MNKEDLRMYLSDCVGIVVSISCECSRIISNWDEDKLLDDAISLGWSYVDGEPICPQCAEKL